MKKTKLFFLIICMVAGYGLTAQVGINTDESDPEPGAILHVKGSGNNDFYVDDATGNVGIGTTTPVNKLVVDGTVESSSGGFLFPDGTIQSTASNGSNWKVAPKIAGTDNSFGGCAIKPNGYLFLFEWHPSGYINTPINPDTLSIPGSFTSCSIGGTAVPGAVGGCAIKTSGELFLFEWHPSGYNNTPIIESSFDTLNIQGPF
ncbi:MAG: hypothetical protein R2764_22400 [Bacteroidales bacterium]